MSIPVSLRNHLLLALPTFGNSLVISLNQQEKHWLETPGLSEKLAQLVSAFTGGVLRQILNIPIATKKIN
jgi:hypothetical protein